MNVQFPDMFIMLSYKKVDLCRTSKRNFKITSQLIFSTEYILLIRPIETKVKFVLC